MKNIILAFFIATSITSAYDADSMGRKAASIINEERRRIGVDTLEYESDAFNFASDWADSTHRYFNIEKKWFSRNNAHRNCEERMKSYEISRNREWKYFAECVATGSTKDKSFPIIELSNGLLGSKDHYRILMNEGYKKIIVGALIKDDFVTLVVFVTTEF